jgi:hypothetical protein
VEGRESKLDFEFLQAGDRITNSVLNANGFGGLSISVESSPGKCDASVSPVAFDTNLPSCGQNDLAGTGDGLALIIQAKSLACVPNSCLAGGFITFTWTEYISLMSISVMDVDDRVTAAGTPGPIENLSLLFTAKGLGNGVHMEYTQADFNGNGFGIKKLIVFFEGSSAIPQITWRTCRSSAGGHGDPHFQSWTGLKYDYHGQCDLVLATSPAFGNGQGLDIHIRTKQQDFYSYVNRVAIKIGREILEIGHDYVLVNRVKPTVELTSISSTTFAGYPLKFYDKPMPAGRPQHVYTLDIGTEEHIVVKVFKTFLSVRIVNPSHDNFDGSVGLTGDYSSGNMIARDRATILTDTDAIGQEWQVTNDDEFLFHTVEAPQYPEKCIAPPALDKARRLRHSISAEKAAEICAVVLDGIDECIFDVLATGDVDIVFAHL